MPPKSSKERVQKYRKKTYDDPEAHDKAKKMDRERKKRQRQLIKLASAEQQGLARKRAGLYQQRWRNKVAKPNAKATVDEPESSMVFATPQSMGKAVRRVESVMPKSPRKRLSIVGKILSKLSPKKAKLIVKFAIKPRRSLEDRKKRADALVVKSWRR